MSRPALPLAHLRPARVALAVAVAASVVGGLAVVAQAFAVGALVVAVVEGRPLAGAAVGLGVVTGVRMLCGVAVEVATARAAGRVARDLRRRVLGSALASAGSPGGRRTTGELAVLLTRGVGATEPWFTRYLPALLLAGVLPLATLAVIAVLDPWSGLIVALTLPLVPLFAALVGMSTRDKAREQWRLMESLSGHFVDLLRGLPTLVAHRRAARQAGVVRAVTDRYRRASLETLRLAFASTVVLELLATLSVALVAVCVGLRLAAGGLDFRTALVVLLLAPEAYWPLRRVGAEFHAAAEGGAALEAADRVLGSTTPAGSGRATDATVTFAGVSLGYAGRPVLAGVDLDLGPGLTALSGPSGCGKSTLLAAVVGELPPLRGSLRLGGVDRAGSDLDAWRRRVAYAPQRPWLIEGTVADNVRLGRPDASDAEVWAALETAGLAHLVLALDGGLGSPLGEDGAGLSAGERARLVLARVLLADRPVVVLDEPTAHLDPETEAVVLEAVRGLARDRTVVVVGHRPAVLAAADRVVDLTAYAVAPPSHSARSTSLASSVPDSPAAPAVDVGAEVVEDGQGGVGWWAPVLGVLAAASGVALTATAGWLITRAAAQPPVLTLMVAIVAVRTFGIARPVLGYLERLVSHDRALRLLARRRAEVYATVVPLVPGRLDLRRGDLLATVVDDVDAVVDERIRVRQPLLVGALVALGSAALAGLLLPEATLVLGGLMALAAATLLGVASVAGRAEQGLVAARGRLATRVEATLTGGRNLVLWQRDADSVAAVDEAGAALARAASRSATGRALGRAMLVGGVGASCVLLAHLAAGRLPGPTAALLVLVPLALGEVLLPLVDSAALSGRCSGARRRLEDLAGLRPAVADRAGAEPLPTPATAPCTVSVTDGGVPLRPVSLVLAPGARLGLTGPSGCGKSTLAGQLLRFTDPVGPAGSVRMDGVDLRDLPLDDVRGRVALVDDDPYLFSSTVAENVRLARPAATDDEVRSALESARLGDWLAGLPQGLHTLVGEGHQGVSGGERARLGIARALLADQPVVVLDEPTAHLDAETARRLTADLVDATRGRSLLWIGHVGGEGLPAYALDAVLHVDERTDGSSTAARGSSGTTGGAH